MMWVVGRNGSGNSKQIQNPEHYFDVLRKIVCPANIYLLNLRTMFMSLRFIISVIGE